MRHAAFLDPKPGVAIATLAHDYPPAYDVPEHTHGSGQLIYATRGVMEISVGQRFWLIPPHFAVWIPPRTPHCIRMAGAVSMRTLYVRQKLAAALPGRCAVLHVTPLLRELIIEAVRVGNLRVSVRLHCGLRDLLLDQIRRAPAVPSSLALPRDARALAVAKSFMANQAASTPLHSLCSQAGASVRTIERIFRKEVGTDFETWRRQARLMKAIEMLAGGSPVKEVSYAVGYRQPSAFVEMFRQTLGTTPKAWAHALANGA